MRVILAGLALSALFFLLMAGWEEWTGRALIKDPPGVDSVESAEMEWVSKATHPKEFRRGMNYQWTIAILWAGVAFYTWKVMRKHDSLDVLSPDRDDESTRERE